MNVDQLPELVDTPNEGVGSGARTMRLQPKIVEQVVRKLPRLLHALLQPLQLDGDLPERPFLDRVTHGNR
jgi:hypothetical protein